MLLRLRSGVALFAVGFLFVCFMMAGAAQSQPFLREVVAIWLFDEGEGKKSTIPPAIATMANLMDNRNGCPLNSEQV